ncbi:TPA: hypothetical protein ACKP9S_003662 [Pseudomonas aeruginosa]
MRQPTANMLDRLDEDQVLHLTMRQLGLLGPDADQPALCEHRTDGHHRVIGSAPLGMLAVNRAGLICPICCMVGESTLVKVSAGEMAAATDAFFNNVPLTPQTMFTVQARHREWEEWVDNGGVLAVLVIRPLADFIRALTAELSAAGHPGPRIDRFPLGLLLKVYNLAEHGSQARKEILGWLETERAINPRNHWMDAITVSETGDLSYNEDLHNLATWRGKQETYFNSAAELFDQLKGKLAYVSLFQGKEDGATLTTPDLTRLFPMRPLERPVKELKTIAPQLALLVEALDGKPLAEVAAALQKSLPTPPLLQGAEHAHIDQEEEGHA